MKKVIFSSSFIKYLIADCALHHLTSPGSKFRVNHDSLAVRRQVFWLLPHRVGAFPVMMQTRNVCNQWHDAARCVVRELQQRVLSRSYTWFPFHPWPNKTGREPQHVQFVAAKIQQLSYTTRNNNIFVLNYFVIEVIEAIETIEIIEAIDNF